MIGPMVPQEYTNLTTGKVILKKFSQLGANSIVMPNIIVNEGAVTGAFAFVNKNLEEWSINVGIPAKKVKDRQRKILNMYEKI